MAVEDMAAEDTVAASTVGAVVSTEVATWEVVVSIMEAGASTTAAALAVDTIITVVVA